MELLMRLAATSVSASGCLDETGSRSVQALSVKTQASSESRTNFMMASD